MAAVLLRRRLLICVFGTAAIAALALVVADARAADTSPPRLKKAQLLDVDANGHTDRVVLTYSEPVNHTADADGTYPFTVAGYTIASVEGVSASTSLAILLTEKASSDLTAKPTVKYSRGAPNIVTDVAGNEAKAETFKWTFPVLALYAAPSGSDANPGTQSSPKRTVNAAVTAAVSSGARDVYLAEGSYAEGTGVELASNIAVVGGYAASTWFRQGKSTISGAPQAVRLDGDTRVSLRYLTLVAGAAGGSSYGVFANASTLTLDHITISTAKGADGANGATPPGTAPSGGNGLPGDPGLEDSSGLFCKHIEIKPLGGPGGTTSGLPGATGGRGGNPGHDINSGEDGIASAGGAVGGQRTPPGQGNWNPPLLHVGADGLPGTSGGNGAAGASAYSSTGYASTPGAIGATGAAGIGGGGGGGGGGGDDNCDSWGGGGGGGGAGGAGGAGGGGGASAGGSFAVFLWACSVTIKSGKLTTGGGSAGGTAAAGQPGGAGGQGGWGGDAARPNAGNPHGGSTEQDDGSNGGRGGNGGPGGTGGPGGGGAGGASIGVLIGGGSTANISKTTYTIGSGGAGGASPGNAGPPGVQANTLIP